MKNLVDKFEEEIDNLSALPITANKVLEVSRNPDVGARELNKVISIDPVMTGKVLKLINSAYYSLSNKITSITQSIIMLGLNTIRNIALAVAVIPIMNELAQKAKNSSLIIEGFWRHSLGTGVLAKFIARNKKIDRKIIEQFFICGLLHDIGKIIINIHAPNEYHNIIDQNNFSDKSIIEIEEEIIGTTHTTIGRMIAIKWGLSEEIKETISFHHNPWECQKKYRDLVNSIYIANIFCNQNEIGFSGDLKPPKMDKETLKELELSEEKIYDWEDQIEEEIRKAYIFLKGN